jgi:PST family polysaccharide transporter
LGLTLPISIACALFADDMILVILGPKWTDAVPIFRLLAPTILVFGLINPFSWLLFSLGKVGRSLALALVVTPLVISGYLIGLPYGPNGVALGYSAAMTAWAVPHICWCIRGTVISFRDIGRSASKPFLSGIIAAVLTFGLQSAYGPLFGPFLRLALGGTAFSGAYLGILLWGMGQKALYLDLVRGLRQNSWRSQKLFAPAEM